MRPVKQSLFWPLLGLLLACGFGAASHAQKQRLIVGLKEAPPFVMREPGGDWAGVSVDLWRAVAEDLNLDYEFRAFELGDLRGAIEQGEVDVVVGALSISPEREAFVDFTHRDVKQKHAGLEDVQTDDGFDQVFTCNDDVKPGHHQKNHDPVVVQSEKILQGQPLTED